MITLTREEAQQVLDALDDVFETENWVSYTDAKKLLRDRVATHDMINLSEILRARLAEPPEKVTKEMWQNAAEAALDLVDIQNRRYEREARLAEEEQEPVAWFTEDYMEDKSATTYSKEMAERWKEKGWPVTPLYTSPPQREFVGLTDEEIRNEANHHVFDESFFNGAVWARGKIKEKNNG